jgi:hypothetical protein
VRSNGVTNAILLCGLGLAAIASLGAILMPKLRQTAT